ncbi:MAG: right-handed parallel beta-helix repeat-containing protein [Rubripirellula sp.]|nr:right-handed parallel beta-helix repeat-containing protein [Rubripirellula sp.]
MKTETQELIIDHIRTSKEENAAAHGYSVEAIVTAARERQEASGHQVIRLAKGEQGDAPKDGLPDPDKWIFQSRSPSLVSFEVPPRNTITSQVGMSPFHRQLIVFLTTICSFGLVFASAETITISSATTTSEDLPNVVSESLERLARGAEEPHQLILQGDFKPTSTVRIQWWRETGLTVSGSVNLDGSALPKQTETVFIAGRNLTLENIRFVNSQGHALIVGGKSDSYEIRNCVFDRCRKGAIYVWNDPHTIESSKKRRGIIHGNRISRFNLDEAKWANDGITVFDQRVTISRNVISNSPTESNGIRAMGRDLVIERNVVREVSKDDAGGIYLWGGPHASLFRGNVVRWNRVVGASRGIYLDDGTSGVRVEENVVEDSSICAIFISGGRDNLVERNVIDRTPVFVHIDSRCLGWDSRPEYAGIAKESVARLREALNYQESASFLRDRYAEFRDLTEKNLNPETYGRPRANRVQENFSRGAKEVWELMDFSAAIKTDFHALNHLAPPRSFGQAIDLRRVSFREQFGILGWDRLQEIGIEETEQDGGGQPATRPESK